jgi:hypothetical protein
MEKNPEIATRVTIRCEGCGNELEGEFDEMRGTWTLDVEACETCKKEAYDKGVDKGREEGGE